jgi:hypothetical protein
MTDSLDKICLALLALAVGTWYPHAIRRGLDGYE